MPVVEGNRLGPYEIVASLGAGGMGEVWRGRDTRLGRDVAIKILPDTFAQNENFRARFEREAKTISSLNHTNICTLFDVGHEKGTHFLVMELIDGESLADRIARGPLPPDQVLRFGAQIAEALDCAHKQGVVHRDLKPANVMLTKSGAKLLDFGLARAGADTAVVRGGTELPTEAKPLTREGTILGTFQYMAPEQLEGAEADARTDIFALGALLYEMATGQRAFQGTTRTSLIAAIVSSQPAPISQVAPMTPPALDHVVRKCLEKDPDDRWQSARDIASELRWISQAGSQAGVSTPITMRRKNRERLAWGLAIFAAAIAIASTALYFRQPVPKKPFMETAMIIPANLRVALNGGLAISPDGASIAIVFNEPNGATALWLRSVGSKEYRRVEGTAGSTSPFWSPDSQHIGFFADGQLKVMEASGSGIRAVCDAPNGRGAAWSKDGTIILAPALAGPLMKVSATGGTPVPLTRIGPGESSHRWPWVLPDGKTFLYLALHTGGNRIVQSSTDEPEKSRIVILTSSSPAYVEPGYLLYSRNNTLFSQRFDARKAAVVGPPVTLSNNVALNDRFTALYTVSSDGTLLLQRGTGFLFSQLAWVDRSGRPEGFVTPKQALYFSPRLSRDQRRLAADVSSEVDGQGDIWTFDLVRGVSSRLTYEKENESAPTWSADDRKLIYFRIQPISSDARTAGAGNIFEIPSGGTGQPQILVQSEGEKRPTDVSADGKWIVMNRTSLASATKMDIWVWSTVDKKERPWLATPFIEQCAALSPDGKWIAYESDESGRTEVYVRAFPDSQEKFRISSEGGMMPAWRGDGREIFYLSTDRKMMSVPVNTTTTFDASTPVTLFDAPIRLHPTRQYDVSADGKRFLLNRLVEGSPVEPVAVLQNWQQRVPE